MSPLWAVLALSLASSAGFVLGIVYGTVKTDERWSKALMRAKGVSLVLYHRCPGCDDPNAPYAYLREPTATRPYCDGCERAAQEAGS